MNRKFVCYLSLAIAFVLLGCFPAKPEGLRSIGLRLALSWSETPVWVGIEASTDLSWAILSGALFITPGGKTLFTSHLDLPLLEDAGAHIRITGGFYYFEPRQPFPYPLAGVGICYPLIAESPIYIGFAGEFIYPLAFPMPMFSISGGWLP